MLSPLPDSAALEAGLILDECAQRSSTMQDQVRNLLRASCAVSGCDRFDAHNAVLDDDCDASHLQVSTPRPEPFTPENHADHIEHSIEPVSSPLATHGPLRTPTHDVRSHSEDVLFHHAYLVGRSGSVSSVLRRKDMHRQAHAWKRKRQIHHVSSGASTPMQVRILIGVASGLMLSALLAACMYQAASVPVLPV